MAPKRHVKNEDSRRVARRTVRVDHLGELEEQGRMASAEAATWQVKCRLTQEQAGEIYNEMAECCEMAEAELATRRADSESVVKRRLGRQQFRMKSFEQFSTRFNVPLCVASLSLLLADVCASPGW